jgi:hypothetical protein
MKRTYLLLSFAASILLSCNSAPKEKQKEKTVYAEYSLPFPDKWTKEIFPIPVSFAPEINYKGHEEIRFAPGWGDSTKNDYWSYAFLWCLDNDPTISDSVVENNLKYYYNGLVRSNDPQFHIPNSKMNMTETSFEKLAPENGDMQTFKGTIKMLDYMRGQPQILNSIVHLKFCSTINKYMIFHEISPKPFTDPVWTDLTKLWTGFECEAKNQ